MTDVPKHSDEEALRKVERAGATLRGAIANVYEGDPLHELIEVAIRHTDDAARYMRRLRDNQ